MSISDRLQELISCKSDIKTAIEEKGVSVTGGLSTYADAIKQIVPPIVGVKVFEIYSGLQLNDSELEEPIVLHFSDCLFNIWNGNTNRPMVGTTCIGYIKSCPNVMIIDINHTNTEVWKQFNWFVSNLPSRSTTLNISFDKSVINKMTSNQKTSLKNKGYNVSEIVL